MGTITDLILVDQETRCGSRVDWDNPSEQCSERRAGKSKYCKVHKARARVEWKANVEKQSAERAERYARFVEIANDAYDAGLAAAKACTPRTMVIEGYAPIEEGPCGFAEIRFPGNTSFGKWATKHLDASKAYGGGLYLWVHNFGQSHDRKAAYAQAYAEVLCSNGVEAYATSRLD